MLLWLACGAPDTETEVETEVPTDTDPADTDETDVPDTDTDVPDTDVPDTDADTDDTDPPVPVTCASTCDCPGTELCYDGTCAEADPSDLAIYRGVVDEMVAVLDPSTGEMPDEGGYPSEALATLASAASTLCDPAYTDAAEARAGYALSILNRDDLVYWPGVPYISRDMAAREIFNVWAAGHALGDPALLDAADDAAIAMKSLLARKPYRDWTLFCTTYRSTSPYNCDSPPWIDVNQVSEVGMAYAVLATDPDSALYGDSDALDIAADEIGAAVSIQAATGEIPLGEGAYIADYDTAYGSYAAFGWAVAASVLGDPTLDAHVALAADWLGPYSDVTPESHRTYPYRYDGDISPFEGAARIPLLYRAGVLEDGFVSHWWDLVDAQSGDRTVWVPLEMTVRSGVPLDRIIRRAE